MYLNILCQQGVVSTYIKTITICYVPLTTINISFKHMLLPYSINLTYENRCDKINIKIT